MSGMTERRLVAIVIVSVFAVLVLSGTTAAAIALPSTCPAGTHASAPGWCTSDATHAAPSSGVSVPDYTTQDHDPRLRERTQILCIGLLTVWLLSVLGRLVYRRRPVDPSGAPLLLA
jgi:hypothetical protein